MWNFHRTLLVLGSFVLYFDLVITQDYTNQPPSGDQPSNEHSGGSIANQRIVFERAKSPVWLRDDLVIERDAELVIEPGVTVKVQPQVGITVRGTLTALGNENERILFTTAEDTLTRTVTFPDIRLVDGPSILAGRVQIKTNGQWRGVCTNSKNWTRADMETACRQMGFQGGNFFMWFNRQMPVKPRILYEQPNCTGVETRLFDCGWQGRKLGSGVCDYHPDIGIECLPRHDTPLPFWRGIRFENANYEKRLRNTLYIPTSSSNLRYVNIMYAGVGRDQNTTSALHVEGVPPGLENIEVISSAYNAVNITNPEAPITINNCTIRNNRGHGIYVNSSYGLALINGCTVNDNGGDGIRFIRAEERPNEEADIGNYNDFCQIAVTSSQTFPIELFAQQTITLTREKTCSHGFTTSYGGVLTLTIIRAVTDRNNTASIEVYDGSSVNHRLLTKFSVRNYIRPQSITTTGNQIFIKFRAAALTDTTVFMRIISGQAKAFDINVRNSDISENIGRGIAVDNLRSQLHVYKSSVSKNEHVAGVHVTSGVGDVNVTDSKISFNEGDGINITYTGGSRNISHSSVSSNKGYGLAVWLNMTDETEFIFVNQTTAVQYTEVYKNIDVGVLHGNYCGDALFNFTGNSFTNCANDALEILSCWKSTEAMVTLQIGHNRFIGNERIALKISPAVNLKATIEYNHFRQGLYGGLYIKTKPLEEFNVLKNDILVQQNYFRNNTGVFAVNMALSPYAQNQYLLFTRNFIKNNRITEPFQTEDKSEPSLIPRSRVAAPIVVGSSNIDIYRNIIENPDSKYEIGSHFEDQSKTINATLNWLGFSSDEAVFHRVFHRYDRYNLAKIAFIPFLLHDSNPLTSKIYERQYYVPKFAPVNSDKVGGEIEGEEIITRGEYVVQRDISIRPGGKLTLEPGVTLKFPPSIGIMVGGRLEARGVEPNSIKFTLKEQITFNPDNATYETGTEPNADILEYAIEMIPEKPIRLLGGKTEFEGRLQVKIGETWGTVCNYGWTIKNAALVCHQLGYVLNPDDWYLERSEVPNAGTTERVLLSNVRCDENDLDIRKCKAEKEGDFENSCGHEDDVGVRCYPISWAGIRFGALADRTDIQYITVEKAGLLDYATNSFKPALQIDFSRQNFDEIRVVDNFYHGLGVLYSHIYTDETVNIIKNSEFSNNRGSGISMKQLGLTLFNSKIENNHIGIEHNPILTGLQQREFAGWFIKNDDDSHYSPFQISQASDENVIEIRRGETKYFVTTRVFGETISKGYKIFCEPGWVLGIQLLNPIENRSSEHIVIHDSLSYNTNSSIWDLKRDLSVFPITSISHGIIIEYESGSNALGGVVLVLSTIRAPEQTVYNRIVRGPVPTLSVSSSAIRRNEFGVHASYYNRYLDELGNHFLRKSNETMKFLDCTITFNQKEAVFIHSPYWDLHRSNLSEIKIMLNRTTISDNGKGIYQFSRDMRASNNLFHYILQDNTIERNSADGFDVALPYVWQYNENFTHTVFMDNNTWANNKNFGISVDGHYAVVNITNNAFRDNKCKTGLMSFKGMEKKLKIGWNKFLNNNGKFVVEFACNSQSEILGRVPAIFMFNDLRSNRYAMLGRSFGVHQLTRDPTFVVGFKGIQKVNIYRNLFALNTLNYQLVAGIKTAKINNYLIVRENWWGSADEIEIKKRIFDFDDWNDHAIAEFRPFLLEDDFQSSHSITYSRNLTMELDNLGGRLFEDLSLQSNGRPYIIQSDITVMPNVTLTIYPGVVMEFAPNIGILVLGTLNAKGYIGSEIIMRPISKSGNLEANSTIVRRKRELELIGQNSIRLCKSASCAEYDEEMPSEGYLEYFNRTTLQWIPMCDPRFTERNAEVVCRELGFEPLNAYFAHDIRIDFHSNSLARIWTWPEPLQCTGTEKYFEDCPIRLNGQQFGHRHQCKWNSNFVFINCGNKLSFKRKEYWGGIRFADPEFEQQLYAHRIHDVHTHSTLQETESTLEFVKVIGAGILHNEKSPAVQSIIKSPKIQYVNISDTASHGINLVAPTSTMNLIETSVQNSLGVGINIISLSGEGRESDESSFTPLKGLNIPYNLFGLIDICDTQKEILVEEKVLVYYKYDNHPVNCIKIFRSAYNIKPLGFRLLQFDLFNNTQSYGIPDFISLYDGDIYNVSSTVISTVTMKSKNEKKLFRSKLPSLSVKLFANGASASHGFIAEIVTLPLSAIGFNRDVQHNISNCIVNNNTQGAILYMAAGEVNPILTIERNQFKSNCRQLYGNFSTCRSAIDIDVQNTQSIFFRSNLLERNQGGLHIKADSRGSATSLRGYIHNNLFVENSNLPVLYVEGKQSSPYQEVTIFRNYFTRNYAIYHNNIILKQVVSNFTFNYLKRNTGLQNLEVSGFDRVRLNIYQTTTHNGFYNNYAVKRESKSTIVAGTAGQHYVDNIFFDPDNDYEMITVNRSLFEFNSTLQLWNTKIDAANNYWGFNTTLAVRGRIRDQYDDQRLLEVDYEPFYKNNKTILDGKCPPGWELVGETCYMYIAAPMTFWEAKAFCSADNASIPYLQGNINYLPVYEFLRRQYQWYLFSQKVWVQHIDRIGECTAFVFQRTQVEDCNRLSPFICEIDPKVSIKILPLADDIVTIAVFSSLALAIILIIIVIAFWWSKSKYRKAQRLERRNSIRQSLYSLRSVGLTQGSFSDPDYRRRVGQMSTRSTTDIEKSSDYRKMVSNGSIDSMEKSAYNSSIEDNQSDVFETPNPNPSSFAYSPPMEYHKSPSRFENQYAKPGTYDLAFKNEGFRDTSTFATNSNYQSQAGSLGNDETPILSQASNGAASYPPSDYYNTDTLPLHEDSTSSSRYDPSISRERPTPAFLKELKHKLPEKPPTPPRKPSPSYSEQLGSLNYTPDYNTVGLAHPQEDRPRSAGELLETDFDEPVPKPKLRSKSEVLLETNFDYVPDQDDLFSPPISDYSRSKSQPLETAM